MGHTIDQSIEIDRLDGWLGMAHSSYGHIGSSYGSGNHNIQWMDEIRGDLWGGEKDAKANEWILMKINDCFGDLVNV